MFPTELYRVFIEMAIKHTITRNAAWYCWHASRRQMVLESIQGDRNRFEGLRYGMPRFDFVILGSGSTAFAAAIIQLTATL